MGKLIYNIITDTYSKYLGEYECSYKEDESDKYSFDTITLEVEDIHNGNFVRRVNSISPIGQRIKVILPDTIKEIASYGLRYNGYFTFPKYIEKLGSSCIIGITNQSITLPATLKEVKDTIFSACRNLESIYVDPQNNNFKSIDGVLYTKDGKKLIEYPQGKKDKLFKIPDEVQEIGSFAFYGNDYIEEIVSNSSNLKEIGAFAIKECNNLKIVKLCEGLETLGMGAITHCKNVREVYLPSTIKMIIERNFSNMMKAKIYCAFDEPSPRWCKKWFNKKENVVLGYNNITNNKKEDIKTHSNETITTNVNNSNNKKIITENVLTKKEEKEKLLKAIATDKKAYVEASEDLKHDRDVISKLIEFSRDSLTYIPSDLRNDKKIVEAALQKNLSLMQLAGDKIKDDQEFISKLVKKNKDEGLYQLIISLPDNLNIITADIKSGSFENGNLYSSIISNNREFFTKVTKNTFLSGYREEMSEEDESYYNDIVDYELDYDSEIRMQIFDFASDEIKSDEEYMLKLINEDVNLFECCSNELKNNKEFVLKAINYNPSVIKWASSELQNDKDVITAAVRKNGYMLKYASPELQDDVEVVKEAVKKNKDAISCASKRINNNIHLIS